MFESWCVHPGANALPVARCQTYREEIKKAKANLAFTPAAYQPSNDQNSSGEIGIWSAPSQAPIDQGRGRNQGVSWGDEKGNEGTSDRYSSTQGEGIGISGRRGVERGEDRGASKTPMMSRFPGSAVQIGEVKEGDLRT